MKNTPSTQSRFDHLAERLRELSSQSRLRTLEPRQQMGVQLRCNGRDLLNFGGNDYLGLAAERSAVSKTPTGSGASALVCGWTDLHQQLADEITALEETEATVLFPTGYAACSGTVATLASEGDLILSEQLNHASLIDGCRLSRADTIIYPHRDSNFVEAAVAKHRDQYASVWIVTDGVFSMDGDIARLAELASIADRFDAHLIVDEAHGTGVLGKNGSGVCEALGVKDRIPIRIGTLSKAIGSQGGFVSGPRKVIDYLVNHCRSLIYSTSLAPAAVSAALGALEIIRDQPDRRARVQTLAQHLRERLSIKVNDPMEATVPIVPYHVGVDADAVALSSRLAEAGFYVPAIRPPTVPEGTARLRISVSAAHDRTMVDALADAIV